MAKRDFYDILGVSKSASADEIKKAHRKLVRQYHPDVNKNNKSAEEKFKEVQEAYDVLSDTSKRQNYDQFGHAGVGAGGAPGGGGDPFEAFRRAQQGGRSAGSGYQSRRGPGGQQAEDFDFNDFTGGGGSGYGDIFEQLFGGRGAPGAGPAGRPRPGRSAAAERGSDIEYPISISFEEAARGTSRTFQMNRGGKTEAIDIKIPGGVKDKLRLKGKGEDGPGGRGDLVLMISVFPHPFFRKDGLDVLMDAPISLYEAMLGTKLTVPTLEGEVTLTIPPGTSSGAKLRIKDRGIFRGSEKGDQFVVVKIIVPKDLDAADKLAIEALSEKHPINARADVKWNV